VAFTVSCLSPPSLRHAFGWPWGCGGALSRRATHPYGSPVFVWDGAASVCAGLVAPLSSRAVVPAARLLASRVQAGRRGVGRWLWGHLAGGHPLRLQRKWGRAGAPLCRGRWLLNLWGPLLLSAPWAAHPPAGRPAWRRTPRGQQGAGAGLCPGPTPGAP